MHFTFWPSLTITTGGYTEIEWAAFVGFVSAPVVAPDKTALEGWSPARFRENTRALDHVEAVSCIVLDDDATGLPLERVVELWSSFAGVAHSSHSHTIERPKWRIVLRCSRDITADEYRQVRRHVGDLARGRGQTLDDGAKDAARLWFVPAYRDGAPYEWAELAGEPLDVDAILSATPAPSPASPAPAVAPRASAASAPTDRRKAMALALGAAWPSKGRHDAQLALAGALRGEGWSAEDALEFLCDVCRAAGDEDRPKREATVRHTWSRGADAPITGWTRLKAHVDGVLVDAARGALGRDADWTERASRRVAELGTSTAKAEATNGLGFTYGAWSAEPPPIDFLVDGLIPSACVGMFFGRADALKTWLMFSLGIAVASGQPWLGRFNVKHAKVGIVDYETGAGNLTRRLFMLRAGTNPNLGAKSFASLKPSESAFWEALALEKFDLVIVDSLRRANPGADENDSKESILPLELASEFSEITGCAVIFIHHAKKSSSDGWPEFRGSGAIEDQVDFAFAVRKSDVSPEEKTVEVRCDKPGDMRLPDPFTVEIAFDDVARTAILRHVQPTGDADSSENDGTDDEIQAAIRLALANGPVPGVKALAKKLGKRRENVSKALELLIERRDVVKIANEYQLDDDDRRTTRLLAFVSKHGHGSGITSITRLADGADVTPHDVERLLLERVIVRQLGQNQGGFVPGPNWPSGPVAVP